MSVTLEYIVKSQFTSPPSSEADLSNAKAKIPYIFPDEYIDFLKISDGGMMKSGRAIFYSCGNSISEHLIPANINRKDAKLFFIGRFSEDEFGYKLDSLNSSTRSIFVLDHETSEIHFISDNLVDFLERYSQPPAKKKWYSFLF